MIMMIVVVDLRIKVTETTPTCGSLYLQHESYKASISFLQWKQKNLASLVLEKCLSVRNLMHNLLWVTRR